MYRLYNCAGFLGHDDYTVRKINDTVERLPLPRGWIGQHGMQRRYHRYAQAAEQSEAMTTRFATEDTEFMLERDEVYVAGIQELGGLDIVFDVFLVDLESRDRRLIVFLSWLVHGDDPGVEIGTSKGHCLVQIVGEGRDAALAGQVIADEGNASEGLHKCRPL